MENFKGWLYELPLRKLNEGSDTKRHGAIRWFGRQTQGLCDALPCFVRRAKGVALHPSTRFSFGSRFSPRCSATSFG